jgi:hypothetical protein
LSDGLVRIAEAGFGESMAAASKRNISVFGLASPSGAIAGLLAIR